MRKGFGMHCYKTVYKGGTGEIIEKKSRFIASVFPIKNEDEALEMIERTRKNHFNAAHNCFAYITGENNELERCSDDGEPSKTAGRPMLDVIQSEGIHNVAVVVTRYFGGTLLGTGGLVRAYQAAVKEGLNNSIIIEKRLAKKCSVLTDYNGIGKLKYNAGTMGLHIIDTEYTDTVTVTILLPWEKQGEFYKKIQEASNGKAQISEICEMYYAEADGELMMFPY